MDIPTRRDPTSPHSPRPHIPPLAATPHLPTRRDPPSPLQILAGLVEERGIEVLFKTNPAACAVLSFIVRTGNTFLGS